MRLRRTSTTRIACVAAALCCAASVEAQLTLNADFDHSSLASWSGDTLAIQLVGRDNYYGNGRWRWLYFKASGVLGANPTFSISRNFAGDSTPGLHELEEHEMVYSYDNENWFFFQQNTLGATNYTFSNSTPFAADEVYVGYAIPYSYRRSAAHTAGVLASPWAEPTVSANAAGVIGQSPAGVDDLGRSVPERDLFGYRITNPATDSATVAKRKVVLTSGLHAGETLGTHTFEGLVNWLISDDPGAARLRETAEFFCYPVLNPSGRFAGMSRTTVGNPDRDPNGLWSPARWSSATYGCQNNNCQDIRVSGEAMMADVASTPGNVVDAFLDLHSTVPDYTIENSGVPDDFGFVAAEDVDADWWLALRQLQPNVLQAISGGGNFTAAGFARNFLNADVEITFETQFSWERNVDHYHTLGANFGRAFYNAWVTQVAGDYNLNGVVDGADYAVWRDKLGTDFDLGGNGDETGASAGVVDQADYDLWVAQFGETAGSGAANGAAGESPGANYAVPEPASPSMLLIGAAMALAPRRRQVSNRRRIANRADRAKISPLRALTTLR